MYVTLVVSYTYQYFVCFSNLQIDEFALFWAQFLTARHSFCLQKSLSMLIFIQKSYRSGFLKRDQNQSQQIHIRKFEEHMA